MKLWMRRLVVIFDNGKQRMVFGENYLKGLPDMDISVKLNKYMSPLKDSATIRISNLTYFEISQLIEGKFNNVEIKCGYKETGMQTIFKGGVTYISNSLGDRKTNTAIILCASELVAKYQSRMLNLSINSGVNIYSALKGVCRLAGIRDSNVSTQLKKTILNNIVTAETNPANFIQNLLGQNGSFITNSDKSNGSTFSIYNITRSNGRVIPVDNKLISLEGGYPQLTKNGLSLTVSPTFNFTCGDTIKIDSTIIDISTSSNNVSDRTKGYYLDQDGLYVIYQMTYNLTNRDNNFGLNLLCKSRKQFKNVLGGNLT